MGSDKALLPWPPQAAGQPPSKETFLSAAIESLALSTDFILVVAGKNESTSAPIAYANGASVVTNPDPSRGQFSSLQVGLHEVLNRGTGCCHNHPGGSPTGRFRNSTTACAMPSNPLLRISGRWCQSSPANTGIRIWWAAN